MSKTTKAAIPSSINRFVKGLFAPYLRYRLSTEELPTNARKHTGRILQKNIDTPRPLLRGGYAYGNGSLTSVGSGDTSCHNVELGEPGDCRTATSMNVVIVSYHTYNNNSALHITGFRKC